MPHDLFNKPVQVTGEVQYPKQGDPGVVDDKFMRLIGNATGIDEQQPGDRASAIGAMLGLGAGRKVLTSKRAAGELYDLLMGRSKRVPRPTIFQDIPDADASLAGMLSGRTHSVAPAPTRIRVHPSDPNFKSMSRTLPQAEGIHAQFRADQKFKGASPDKVQYRDIGSLFTRSSPAIGGVPKVPAHNVVKAQNLETLVKEKGSLHNAAKQVGVKPMTETEIRGLMEGPRKAHAKGLISLEEMNQMLAKNQAKIDAYVSSLSKADAEAYHNRLVAKANMRGEQRKALHADYAKKQQARTK